MSLEEFAPALQSEYFTKFLPAEEAHLETLSKAHRNQEAGGYPWYAEGPAKEHEFTRSEMARTLSQSTDGVVRVGKTAYDHITTTERAFKIRNLSRLELFVRGAMRAEQVSLAGTLNREHLERVVS